MDEMTQAGARPAARHVVLLAFLLSGTAALIYEVTWTRALSLILGSTTYAISTMLSTFMAGLALGGFFGGRIADRAGNLLLVFGILELGIGVTALTTIPLIYSIPPLYLKIHQAFHPIPGLYFLFQFLLCAAVMLIPTSLMGATFPVVSRHLTTRMAEMGRGVGTAYFCNTFGAICGAAGAGFLLIPNLGVRQTTIVAAVLNLTVAAALLFLSRARLRPAMTGLALLLVASPLSATLLLDEEAWYVNYYLAHKLIDRPEFDGRQDNHRLLFDEEDVEGRVKLWRSSSGKLLLYVGGKPEGTASIDIPNTVLLSYLPAASHPGPDSMLVIGLGSGVTLAAAKEVVPEVSLVEINRAVLDGVGRFGPPELLNGVNATVQDARNYLLVTDRKFDIISSEPSYPSESSVANLFTADFYRIARAKLNHGGLFCQWLPYYLLTADDVTMMLRTFQSVFPHVYLWKVFSSNDLIMVGAKEPFRFGPDEIAARVATLNVHGISLPFILSRSPEEVAAIAAANADLPINTEDRPVLEFRAARNLVTGVRN